MALLEFNLDGIIEHTSGDISSFLGYNNSDLIGNHISVLLNKSYYKSDNFHLLWEKLRSGEVINGDFVFVKKDNNELTINGIFSPVLIKEGASRFTLKSISFDYNKLINDKNNFNLDKNEINVEINENLNRLIFENRERLKELAAINQTTTILKEGKSIEETIQQICSILPKAWQYPDNTVAKITYDKKEFKTKTKKK